MRLDLQDCELCLAANEPLRLRRARGLSILCTAGKVWLTVEGEAADVFLAAGQRHRLAGNGLALIEAVGGARVRLLPAPGVQARLGAAIAALAGGNPARPLRRA